MESENCGNLDNVGRVPSKVTTLYHARNSNVFRSSESSVQITSAQNNNSSCPRQSQNFCELDIVTRKERERREASLATDQQPIKNQGVFRKTIFDKQVKERQSGVLCLGNLVKDVDEDYCKPIISRSRDKRERDRSPTLLSCEPEDGSKEKELVDFLKREFKERIEAQTLEFNYQSHRVNSRSIRGRSPIKCFGQNSQGHIMTESDISSQVNPHRRYRDKMDLGNCSEYREQIKAKETLEYNYDNEVIYSRSMSRRRKGKSPSPRPSDQKRSGKHGDTDNSGPGTDSAKKTIKFADIEEARTMYYVKLPNQNTFAPQQYTTKKKVKNKHHRDFGECSYHPNVMNKMDSDIPTFTSLGTESSVPVKLKSDTSLDYIMMFDNKKQSNRQHHNTPRDDNMPKFSKNKDERKTKHKKKLRPTSRGSLQDVPRTSHPTDNTCDTVPCKEEKKDEISVLYKKKYDDRPESTTEEKRKHKSRQKSSGKEKSSKGGKSSKKDKSSVRDKSPAKEKPNKKSDRDGGKKKRPASASVRKLHERDEISKNLKVKEAMEPLVHADLKNNVDNQNSKNSENADSSKHQQSDNLPEHVKQSVVKSVNLCKHGDLDKPEGIELKYQQAITTEIQGVHADDTVLNIYITDSVFKTGSYSFSHDTKNKSSSKTTPMLTFKNKYAPTPKPGRICLKTSTSNDFNSTFRRQKLKKKKHSSKNSKSKSISENKKEVTLKFDTESILASVESIEKDTLPDDKSIKTGDMPSELNCQEVAVSTPALKYLGYFVPPQVAERFSRRYSSPHHLQSAEVSTKSSMVPFGQDLVLPRMRNRSRSCVVKKGEETDLTSRPSKQFNSRMSSETQIGTSIPRKKRSKSVVTKVDTLNPNVCEDLQTLIVLQQQADTKKKRLKVVPKPIEDRKLTHVLRLNSVSEYDKKPTQRLKPKKPSRSEQEAILNLPICQYDGTTTSNLPSTSDISSRFKSNSVFSSRYSLSTEDERCRQEVRRRRKKCRRTVDRCNVSAVSLIPRPIAELQCSSANQEERHNVTTEQSELTVQSTSSYLAARDDKRLVNAHMILGEKILEICNKSANKDGKVVEGYVVSGMEPPKRLTSSPSNSSPIILENCEKLHIMFFPPTQIFNSEISPKESYTFGKFMQQQAVKETICEKPVEEVVKKAPEVTKSKDVVRSPIQVKTKRKLIPFELKKRGRCAAIRKHLGDLKLFRKPEKQAQKPSKCKASSTASLDVHSTDVDTPKESDTSKPPQAENIPWKPKQTNNKQNSVSPPREMRSLSRINSAVKVMESSLQIIKEESQSTDSSSKKSSKKKSKIDIKQSSTQTELVTSDIDKLKDVINYLYFAMDKRISADTISTDTGRTDPVNMRNKSERIDYSTTDTSSCCEQFKNMVKNVKPKFGTLRRLSRTELSQRSPVVSRTCSADGGFSAIPTRPCRRPYSHRTEYGVGLNEQAVYSASSVNFQGIPTSRKRSQSLDVISPTSYSTPYSYELITPHRVVEKVDKAICTDPKPEIKSSTSISDFSSIVITLDEHSPEASTQKNFDESYKQNEEKSVQCVITEPTTNKACSVRTEKVRTESISTQSNMVDMQRPHHPSCVSEQVSLSTEKDDKPTKKKKKTFDHKCLQTSNENLIMRNEKTHQKSEEPKKKSPYSTEIYNLHMHKPSSHSFIGERRRHLACPSLCTQSNSGDRVSPSRYYKLHSSNDEKSTTSPSKKESSRSDGKKSGKNVAQMDYVNLLKLERHLEQVLGLYPTVCKAIRAQLATSMNNKKLKRKQERSRMFTSQETLATTVDTITEYHMMDTDDSRRSKDRYNRSMPMKLPLHRYLFDNGAKFQRSMQRNKDYKYSFFQPDERYSGRGRSMDFLESPIPYTDTSSSSNEDYLLRYSKGRRGSKTKWDLKKIRKNKDYDSSHIFSDELKDNWSVGSPLYSISTPSLTFSKTDFGIPKSKSLTHSATNQAHTSQLSTSKSLVEISSSKSLNRKVLMKRLKEDIFNDGRSRTFRLGTQQVFVLSVDSSKPLPTSPSRMLATVEQQLKKTDSSSRDNSKASAGSKRKTGEPNFFSNHTRVQRGDKGDQGFNHQPFYIHNNTNGSSSNASERIHSDSLNQKTCTLKSEEEDLGNFSADSLESSDSRCDFNYSMDFMCSNVFPPKQNYFVYTSTVNYGSSGVNRDKDNERSRPVARQTACKRSCSSKQSSSKPKPIQTSEALVGTTASLSAVQTTSTNKSSEDSSNTHLSESGYETSNRTRPSASIKNFFKKGNSLLDIFRHTSKTKAAEKLEESNSGTTLTNFSNLWSKSLQSEPVMKDVGVSAKEYNEFLLQPPTKVYWASLVSRDKNKDKDKQQKITFTQAMHTDRPQSRDKGTSTCANKRCSVSMTKNYEKQKSECHEYAEKVMMASQCRNVGTPQYNEFKEIPLELLIGRPVPSNKHPKNTEKPSTSFAPPPERHTAYCDRECCMTESVQYVTVADDKIVFTSTSDESGPSSQRKIMFASTMNANKVDSGSNTSSKNPLSCGSLGNMIKPKCLSKGVQQDGKHGSIFYKRTHDKGTSFQRVYDPTKRSSQASMGCACDFDDDVIVALEKTPVGTMTFGDVPAGLEQQQKGPRRIPKPVEKATTHEEPMARGAIKKEESVKIIEAPPEPMIPIPPLPMDSSDSIGPPGTLLEDLIVQPSSLQNLVSKSRSKSINRVAGEADKESLSEKELPIESEPPAPKQPSEELQTLFEKFPPEKSVSALEHPVFKEPPIVSGLDEEDLARNQSKSKSNLKVKVTIPQNVESTSQADSKSIETGEFKADEEVKPLSKPVDSASTNAVNLSEFEEPSAEAITSHSCQSFVEMIMDEIVATAVDESYLRNIMADEEAAQNAISVDEVSLEDGASKEVELTQEEAKVQAAMDNRSGLTDKQVFDKLLTSFEKEDEIAVRLSKDDTFFNEQIKTLKRDSDESLENEQGSLKERGASLFDADGEDKHRSTHFWEEKMKALRAKEENPVKTDDIGTCFSRGFRPDNIALSGDACFNLNKQDKMKFTKGMLTNEESIIDFSERETPLDYLLALGFMVDEASNALKDDDIRSRLLAAITEARVWINKITTTQGTLLYLVAYKSRPKTMRYFLQLVEAIINKRINNAIKLDGFLRILEKVEEGEIQMINILGADKFEDEENEEKIVKKQLRQLFITVYKIAERESLQRGKELSPQAIVLLRILAAKYRAGLHPHLELIARYIGQDLLVTETQLEAAMIFLSRLDTAEVKLKEFEAYCDIKCEKKKQKRAAQQAQEEAEALKSEERERRVKTVDHVATFDG